MADLLIIKRATQEVVKRIKVSSLGETYVDRVVRGIEINLNHEEYYVDEREIEAAREAQREGIR